MSATRTADRRRVVIVGAGSAGCTVAGFLSANPDLDVVLVEEGDIVSGFGGDLGAIALGSLNHAFAPEASRRWDSYLDDGRSLELIGGMTVGGSGRINGGYFVRPTTADLHAWVDASGGCFPVDGLSASLRQIENDHDFGDSPLHGNSGPIPVQRYLNHRSHPASDAFAASARANGFAAHPDLNDGGTHGIGPVPFNARNGMRIDPATAVLAPALHRENLTLLPRTRVIRLIIDSGISRGVSAVGDAGEQSIRADDVVVAAGTIGTPALLLRSGIGPADRLLRNGIGVQADLPATGLHFWNHPCIDLRYRPRPGLQAPGATTQPDGTGRSALDVPSFMHLALHSDTAAGHPFDAEYMATRVPYGVSTGLDPKDEWLSMRITAMGAGQTGSVLVHEGGGDDIRVEHRFLESSHDRALLRDAVRLGVELMHTRPFTALIDQWAGPSSSELESDESADRWISASITTAFHMIGSCPMGHDPASSVVDSRFRVHGVQGLRLVDASVFPAQISRGPAAAVVALAHTAAQLFD